MIKERTKNTDKVKNENMLLPDEITEKTEKAISDCKIPNVSQNFLDNIRRFVKSNLVDEISRVRESMGLKSTNIPQREVNYERKDEHMQKYLRNFIHITQSQFDEFIQLIWKKYQEAIIQPGESVGAICA